MSTRQEQIKNKGFDMMVNRGSEEYVPDFPKETVDYSKIQVGAKTLDSPLADINFYKKVNPKIDKERVLRAINNNNIEDMREISDFFYKANGIYTRLCQYMANLYRYDWVVTPIVLDKKLKSEKVAEGFYKTLMYLDAFKAKKIFGETSLKVVKNGVFYAYKVDNGTRMTFQELPVRYCRSRFSIDGKPTVEFSMKYFDDTFTDTAQRIQILKVFPPEFQKGYILYKEGKLPAAFAGDQQGWYMLDYRNTVRFSSNGSESPMFMAVIPAIMDLQEAKELDRKKMIQQLLKIIIQQMPLDKNGELIFDVDEARMLHNNAVAMLGQAIGVDVLTTFAKVDAVDLSDKSTTSEYDGTSKAERAVFNEAGISQMQFNTSGNLALEKSIANDEASMSNLLYQYEEFMNELLNPFNQSPKRLIYRVNMLTTTIYNYKELAKLYKEQMSIGFSKILSQVALGHSQSSVLATAYFENEVLNLNDLFTPPAMSSNVSGGDGKSKTPAADTTKEAGRPAKPNDQKSDKTLRNQESMS